MIPPAGRGKCLRNPMPRGEHRILRRDGPRELSSEGSWPIVAPDLRLSEATTEARLGGGSSRQRSRVATVPAAPVPSRGGRTAHHMQWRPTSPRKHRKACCLDGQAPVLVVLWSCGDSRARCRGPLLCAKGEWLSLGMRTAVLPPVCVVMGSLVMPVRCRVKVRGGMYILIQYTCHVHFFFFFGVTCTTY